MTATIPLHEALAGEAERRILTVGEFSASLFRFHTGVAAAVGLILALALGPILMVTYPLLAAIGWARVQLRDHTVAQVLAAVPIGALSAGLTFVLVR